jgi:hypothetical protein
VNFILNPNTPGAGTIDSIVRTDAEMMMALKVLRQLDLPDGWLSAGYIRNRIWDHLHGYKNQTPPDDVDVVYFDNQNSDKENDISYERLLVDMLSNLPWSVKNQARMHIRDDDLPYTSTGDAISKWPETATAIALALDQHDNLLILAPYGLTDLLNMEVKPTDYFLKHHRRQRYEARIKEKNWQAAWPKLTIFSFGGKILLQT